MHRGGGGAHAMGTWVKQGRGAKVRDGRALRGVPFHCMPMGNAHTMRYGRIGVRWGAEGGFVDESGMCVPLHTPAAFCPRRPPPLPALAVNREVSGVLMGHVLAVPGSPSEVPPSVRV